MQSNNATDFALTVPDEIQCKPASLIAACVLAVARLLRISCLCVCVCVCVCACVRACVRACVLHGSTQGAWMTGRDSLGGLVDDRDWQLNRSGTLLVYRPGCW